MLAKQRRYLAAQLGLEPPRPPRFAFAVRKTFRGSYNVILGFKYV
jgi:hypothetical protein